MRNRLAGGVQSSCPEPSHQPPARELVDLRSGVESLVNVLIREKEPNAKSLGALIVVQKGYLRIRTILGYKRKGTIRGQEMNPRG